MNIMHMLQYILGMDPLYPFTYLQSYMEQNIYIRSVK